jgi:hypothetical protein
MELKYGRTETYKYEINTVLLKSISDKVNIHQSQVLYLYQLVDGDIDKLKLLILQMKRNFINYCPGDKNEVYNILNLNNNNKFKRPIKLSPFFNVKRVPRKMKKKYKNIFSKRYSFLTINEKLSYIQFLYNRKYHDFLICEVILHESLYNVYKKK